MIPQAPYSPSLSCNFYLFPKLKLRVKYYHFKTPDSFQKVVTDTMKTLTEADFQSCYNIPKVQDRICSSEFELKLPVYQINILSLLHTRTEKQPYLERQLEAYAWYLPCSRFQLPVHSLY
jgi:hypothetical protein